MPALTPVVDTLDAVPEPARQFYVQKDGKYHVDLSAPPAGFVPATQLTEANAKVVEFRDNNIRLTQKVSELEPLKAKFEGIDPEVAKAAIAAQKELGDKGIKNKDDLATAVKSAVDAALAPVLAKQTATEQALEKANVVAADSLLRSTVNEKFTKAGGQPNALDFIVTLVRDKFEVKNGIVAAKQNVFSADKPGDPLGLDEFMTGTARANEFAFKKSSGSGSVGGDGKPTETLKPGQTILKNPTPQQLGEHATAILKGTVKVVHDPQ